jgi:uncharacterized protein (DUF58 family)
LSRLRATGLLAAALALGGALFDSPSLYVPAVGLALLAAAAAAWVGLAARGAAAERLPGDWSVVEGEPYRVAVQLRSGRVPAPGGTLLDPLLAEPRPLGPRFGGRVEAETSFEGRGRRPLPPPMLRISDPFGLRVVGVRGPATAEVLVLPRIEPVRVPLQGGELARQGGEGQSHGDDVGLDAEAVDFEIDGLRPYRPGTPASRIHWRSVARSGELIEHRLVSGGGSDPLVVLDAHAPADAAWLDRAVRAAASLCRHFGERGGCVLLLPGESRPRRLDRSLRGWADMHARLALVGRTRRSPVLRRRRSAAVYWVSAAADAAETAARAGALGGYLVTPGEPQLSDAFAVAGCRGRRLVAARGAKPEEVAA